MPTPLAAPRPLRHPGHLPRLLTQRLDARWRFRSQRPDPVTLDWLRDPGSLTARLVTLADGRFRVRLRRQCLARPTRDEARQLGLSHGEWVLIREVVLEGRGQPWVQARSVIPRATLAGPNVRLRRLGTRPLGAFLFRDPGLRRDQVRVLRDADGHWGRCSRFLLRGRPLLVAEYFLPDLPLRPR